MQITIESIFRDRKHLCHDIIKKNGLQIKIIRLSFIILISGALYGFTMGIRHSFAQAITSAAKVPALFFLTLLICLPTLHFIGLLLGSRATFLQTVTMLLSGVAVTTILLASFAPISIFFLGSGSQYGFMLFMHVAIFAICGLAGLLAIYRNFHYIRARIEPDKAGPGNLLLFVWMGLYMFVGSQLAYILAPFVGRSVNFLLFRVPEDNFYTYLFSVLLEMMQ